MTNTTNQTVLTLLAKLKAKYSAGGATITSVSTNDAKTLADWVNQQTDTATALSALTIAMENATGGTQISNIITATTNFYNFIYQSDTTA